MKKVVIYLAIAALLAPSCAKSVSSSKNESEKAKFEAWVKVNYPTAQKTELGAYIVPEAEVEGTGMALGSEDDYPYVRVEFSARNLDGTYKDYTSESIAKQLDEYDRTKYYGPKLFYRGTSGLVTAIRESMNEMRVGGHRKILTPGWLNTVSEYDTAQEYLDNCSGTDIVYEFDIVEAIADINEWEIDSIGRYLSHNFPKVSVDDSLVYGLYFIRDGKAVVEDEFESNTFTSDSTIHINYTGSLLNGRIFDTTDYKTAEDNYINSGKTYSTVLINWDSSDYTEITMTSSATEVIDGFAKGISQMHRGEKATVIFISEKGYSSTGSGDSIPSYSPLRFDIEVVMEEDDE